MPTSPAGRPASEMARVIEWLCDEDSAPLSGGAIPAYGRA